MPFCERNGRFAGTGWSSQGVIAIVDRDWQRGKAMRWAVGDGFDRLPQWWRREKKPSLLEAVPLEEFLANRNDRDTHSLNTYPPSGGWKVEIDPGFASLPIRSPP